MYSKNMANFEAFRQVNGAYCERILKVVLLKIKKEIYESAFNLTNYFDSKNDLGCSISNSAN